MIGAVRLSGSHRAAAKAEILVLGIADRPAAGLSRQIREREDARFFFNFDSFLLTLDGRRPSLQAKAVRFADNSILRDGKTLADLARRQTFRPKFFQPADFFVCPAHRVPAPSL